MSRFDEDGNLIPVRVYNPSGERSRTKQSDALISDVNSIIARHVAHSIPLPDGSRASYGDFSDIGSYHECYDRVKRMQATFSKLPADVRKLCHNDPGEFLELLNDPGEHRPMLEKIGLVAPLVEERAPEAPEAPVVDDQVVT